MRKTHILLFLTVAATLFCVSAYSYIFKLPSSGLLSSIQGSTQGEALHCFENDLAKPLDSNGHLNLLVWNIYKQNKLNWRESLVQYSTNTQLALLQEVSMSKEFKDYINHANWFGSHADAFKSFDITTGVLNLSTESPALACAYIEAEPWLRLPKSGIYARYPLSDNRILAVVNLHSVNFTYGTQEYTQQLAKLATELKEHDGPIIFAGDLNSWSAARLTAIKEALQDLSLTAVTFSPDNRTQFVTGLALDHVFYRGLTLVEASSPVSDASDHNPLLITFLL